MGIRQANLCHVALRKVREYIAHMQPFVNDIILHYRQQMYF